MPHRNKNEPDIVIHKMFTFGLLIYDI